MPRPCFTLAAVTSADGFIARTPGEPPAVWASAEEQALFRARVEAAGWAIMGRGTHEAADRPERRRIVLSRRAGGWRRPTQLWLDPARLEPGDLPGLVAPVYPLGRGLVLGGTRVHDWFDAAGAIDLVKLTVEPLRFGAGIPLFSDAAGEPVAVLAGRGYQLIAERRLNAGGTRLLTFRART